MQCDPKVAYSDKRPYKRSTHKRFAINVSVIKLLADSGFPLGMKKVRTTAFSFAVKNCICGFSNKKQLSGYEWRTAFLLCNLTV